MKLKKVLALVLSAALVVSAFAGCGGNSSKTSTESITASEVHRLRRFHPGCIR